MPIVLSIAGSDPTGGAGVQADQRMLEAMNCTALSVVTALTSQSTHGVSSVYAVPTEVLRSQLETVLTDVRPDAVKIGVLPSGAHVRLVAESVDRFDLKNVVLDPVLAPTTGEPFLDDAGIESLLTELAPRVLLLTPNVPEATRLTNRRIDSREDMEAAGRTLWELGVKNALIKGGHLCEQIGGDGVRDLFVDRLSDLTWISGGYVDTPHRHGSGCYLSSAIAAGLAHDIELIDAIRGAKRLLEDSLKRPRIAGKGRGSPGAPDVAKRQAMEHQFGDRLARLTGIYFVTDDRIGSADKVREVVLAALIGGVRNIQLRDKSLSTKELTALAERLRDDTRACGALLIVNDYAGIAHAVDADGVHLGPDDISPAHARQILGPSKLIGISANSSQELAAYGEDGIDAASYIGCGPVFGTRTKADAGKAVGTEALRRMRGSTRHPVIAVGGISAANIEEVQSAGAAGAAVVSAISATPDPEAAARELVRLWNGGPL
jgi:hydroxymethylpyrimidine kinase/phosphomethylpyrimidine kinase/thiamine-phosphate diphosphorylase